MAQSRQNQMQIKVLRIGVVQDGKIVQERLIKAGDPVTVGDNPKNTFNLPLTSVPKRFTLFVPGKNGSYTLAFVDGMNGRVSHKDALLGLDELRNQQGATKKGSEYLFPLTDGNRGKVQIEGVTFLFQFVPPPPEPIGHASIDFRPRLIEDDDPVYFGFLGLFSALATVFCIYVQNTEVRDVTLDEIPERFTRIIMKPEVKVETPELTDEGKEEEKKEEEKKEAEKKEEPVKKELTEAEKQALEARRRAEMERKVMEQSKLLAGIIGTRGESNNGRAEDLFTDSDFAGQNLEQALQGVNGAEIGTAANLEAKKAQGGQRGDADIGDLTGAATGSAKVGSGPSTKVNGSVNLQGEDLSGAEGDADKIRAIVRKQSGQIKYCYESQLKLDPSIQGRVEVSWNLKDGRVTTASLITNTTGSDELAKCIVSKVKQWRFEETAQGEVVYPFILTPSS